MHKHAMPKVHARSNQVLRGVHCWKSIVVCIVVLYCYSCIIRVHVPPVYRVVLPSLTVGQLCNFIGCMLLPLCYINFMH